jgi:HSP20 family molecular chaperone IbpA
MLAKYSNSMSKHDPFDALWCTYESLINHDLFADLFSGVRTGASQVSYRTEQNENEMVASFDLPGVKPGDVELSVVDQALTITYTLRGKKQTQQYTVHHDYDASATTAKLEHGVLELRFPRITRTKCKKIAIEVK